MDNKRKRLPFVSSSRMTSRDIPQMAKAKQAIFSLYTALHMEEFLLNTWLEKNWAGAKGNIWALVYLTFSLAFSSLADVLWITNLFCLFKIFLFLW